MAAAVQRVGAGHWDVSLPTDRSDEIGVLAQAFDRMTDQLSEVYNNLEEMVVARTEDVRHRSVQLQAASHVAREAARIRDVERLLNETVDLISDRFGFYHAGIFLIDEPGRYAVLQAASSQGGERMLAREHKLRVAEEGIVGYVAGSGDPRIALDVGEDAVFFDNPDLPETRSEMALPLEVRGRVIGVLDVQSKEPAVFSDEDVSVLQTMADQVALAIDNARLLAEAEERIQEIRSLLRRESEKGWRQMTRARPGWRYVYGSEEASEDGDPIGENGTQLTMPLQIRDVVVGKLDLKLGDRSPTPEEEALIREVLDQASQALESARLFQETQRRAARERLVAEITAKVRASSDVEGVMRTAVRELGRVMGANRVRVQLTQDPASREEGKA
jgi:GAF domain-containing protein